MCPTVHSGSPDRDNQEVCSELLRPTPEQSLLPNLQAAGVHRWD